MAAFELVNNVKVMLTHECNLACSYCSDSVSKNRQGLFNLEDQFINWIKGLPKLNIVMLYGGEPLCSERFAYFLNKLLMETPPSLNIGIFTNGTHCNDELIKLLKNSRVRLNITKAPCKESHDAYRKFKNGKGSYDVIIDNLQLFSEVAKSRSKIVCTVTPEYLDTMYTGIINDFRYCNIIELNIVRAWSDFHDFKPLANSLAKITDYLVDNKDKCLRNFSNYPPIDTIKFKTDYYRMIQGTYVNYANGVNQIVVDIDGKIYPGNSVVGRGFCMGDIYGNINEENYNYYTNIRDNDFCQDCEIRYACAPNYEIYNPENTIAPYKISSYCKYSKTMINAMENYYHLLKQKGAF